VTSPEQIILRIETDIPPSPSLTIYASQEAQDELRAALEAEGLKVSEVLFHGAVTDYLQIAVEVSPVLGSIIAGTVRALNNYWRRNEGKKFKATFNNAELEFEGMSIEEIERLMRAKRAEWDAQWQKQGFGSPRETDE